jgi:hypothetical protein
VATGLSDAIAHVVIADLRRRESGALLRKDNRSRLPCLRAISCLQPVLPNPLEPWRFIETWMSSPTLPARIADATLCYKNQKSVFPAGFPGKTPGFVALATPLSEWRLSLGRGFRHKADP